VDVGEKFGFEFSGIGHWEGRGREGEKLVKTEATLELCQRLCSIEENVGEPRGDGKEGRGGKLISCWLRRLSTRDTLNFREMSSEKGRRFVPKGSGEGKSMPKV